MMGGERGGHANLRDLRRGEPRTCGVLPAVRAPVRRRALVGVPPRGHHGVLRSRLLHRAERASGRRDRPRRAQPLLRHDPRRGHESRRHGGEVRGRRGDGGVRLSAGARGRRAAGRAGRARDASHDRRAERRARGRMGRPARHPDRGGHRRGRRGHGRTRGALRSRLLGEPGRPAPAARGPGRDPDRRDDRAAAAPAGRDRPGGAARPEGFRRGGDRGLLAARALSGRRRRVGEPLAARRPHRRAPAVRGRVARGARGQAMPRGQRGGRRWGRQDAAGARVHRGVGRRGGPARPVCRLRGGEPAPSARRDRRAGRGRLAR